MVLWGECAYPVRNSNSSDSKSHNQLSMVVDLLHRQRDDIAIRSDLLDEAAAALLANGWRYSSTKFPLPHTSDRCDRVGRRSTTPATLSLYSTRTHKLPVLPSYFVGRANAYSKFAQNHLVWNADVRMGFVLLEI